MPKRKPLLSDDEEDSTHSEEESRVGKKPKKSEKADKKKSESSTGQKKTVKKPPANSPSPHAKEEIGAPVENDTEIVVHRNDEGEKYLDLGRNRRATVRLFKGTPLLDIREYYGSGTDVKPGKKGISLKLDEWETLKQSTSAIDKLFSSIKK